MGEINVSVRTIVEFILRSGSIDAGYMSQNRMRDGVLAHQRVQRARKREAAAKGYQYDAEVRLKINFDYNGIKWNVIGVADGIFKEAGGVTIEEIKSTLRPLDELTLDESHWHMAQAKCYGHMYAELNGVDEVTIRLTYCAVERDVSRTFDITFTAGELKAFFYDLVERYRQWAEFDQKRLARRNETASAAAFPYEGYRLGQREFAVRVYKTIQNERKLFIEAPTGTGKTISALFPAIKALGTGLADKIFYLTAKTITRQAAEQAANMMLDQGCELTYVAMTARDKLCFLTERVCSSAVCPYANGHFDRINDALWVLINGTARIGRSKILESAQEHMVCPYELMLDAALFADIIICDYNYAFDPTVSLKRFFGGAVTEKYVFLIDEAHNLVDRAREMFSASLVKSGFAEIKKLFRGKNNKIGQSVNVIRQEINNLAASLPSGEIAAVTYDEPKELYKAVMGFVELMDKWLAASAGAEGFGPCMDVYFRALDFIRTAELYNDHYIVYIEKRRNDAEITLMCLDPSENLAMALSKSSAAIFFSATLTPLSYFKNVLGGNQDDGAARLPSPFDPANCLVVVEHRISTKYKDRTDAGFEKVAEALYTMAAAKKGNYFAFFPSYAFMDRVLAVFTANYPEIRTQAQTQDMTEPGREAFLVGFNDTDSAVLAFAVMGGVFSEGIDLPGARLIGAAIVGVGLPLVSQKRDALRDYYDRTLAGGFEYAYMYPGMNKVLQAAGRVIRTETDKGVILLIDARFADSRYTELFPHLWRDYRKPSPARGVGETLRAFWEGEPLG